MFLCNSHFESWWQSVFTPRITWKDWFWEKSKFFFYSSFAINYVFFHIKRVAPSGVHWSCQMFTVTSSPVYGAVFHEWETRLFFSFLWKMTLFYSKKSWKGLSQSFRYCPQTMHLQSRQSYSLQRWKCELIILYHVGHLQVDLTSLQTVQVQYGQFGFFAQKGLEFITLQYGQGRCTFW